MPRSFTKNALKSLPKNAPEPQKNLLSKLGECIANEDLAYFDTSLFSEMAKTHWLLAKERKRGRPEIAIYCPVTDDKTVRKTVIDIVSDDMAFIVDSIAAEINKNNFLIDLLIHPVLYVNYDDKGNLKDVSTTYEKGYIQQSHIHVHIKDILSDQDLVELEKGLYNCLDDVFVANRDWKKMLKKLKETRHELELARSNRPEEEIKEYCAFLDYLYNNNFTMLGFREYRFVEKKGVVTSQTVKESGLGLLSDGLKPAYISENKEGLPRNLQELRLKLPPVSVSKTNRLATVHRRVPMDAIAIKVYDERGKVVGEKLFIGLFTSVTYSRSVSDVPYLRQKVEDVMEMSNFLPGSHDRKALRHVLEKYPRDELFQSDIKSLFEISRNILRLQERQRIALFMREDAFGRYISCMVYVPRERFGTNLRQEITKILEEDLNGKCTNFTTAMDDGVFARAMFTISIKQKNPPCYDASEIEQKLQEAGETWSECLSVALAETSADGQIALKRALKYGEAFPIGYMDRYKAKQAVFDIEKIEAALDTDKLQLDLYRPEELNTKHLRLKVYNPGHPLNLSDLMPILGNMGLVAISEFPFEVTPNGEDKAVWIHDFLLETNGNGDGQSVSIDDVKELFEISFTKTWYNEVENDTLNHLVLNAGLNWYEVRILRAYVRYLRQIRYPFSRSYIQEAITDYPNISIILVELFKCLHDPEAQDVSADMEKKYLKKLKDELEKVVSLDQDKTLRLVASLIQATLRTNYYQRDSDGCRKPYLSLKFDSTAIAEIPEPKPYREIFVYSSRVEAIHLRGDKIARGGLRWSDRHEDFRTEILDLMKAQMVKNAVIVPVGSKGGFVVKTKTNSREEFMEEGIRCYKTFIHGLLDITDNLDGDIVIPPQNVVRRDDDDPYLVVAADKGTATFSDIANGISAEYGFWLGDAFASGGSAGYDHKKMGITARGAWESVKLHFRQLNHNTQKQPFDVIGVGDMGGDVFGNGMLLSDQIQLVAAFNHLHIFCDPEPDAAKSYKERKRLFDQVKGWDAYNTKLLSKGGRIFSRADKSLKLTPEICARFDIQSTEVSPIELIQAILRARTDLLWFGGIGTYIKAKHETAVDVGDKANDSLRINGEEVRAKVIGEGANLGVTQLGRIEFAENGGKINTDFLDNSGGVDSSDHEVNIKILLSEAMRGKSKSMTTEQRNKLLEAMTEEIVAHVLRNNYQQAQALSITELQARENLKIQEEFIQDLERNQGLNRALEGLPDSETIEARLRLGKGMTRPELCILTSYAKIDFTKQLLDSDIPDDKDMQNRLLSYFPERLREKYAGEILVHRLHREIIATYMANSLVNRMGPTFIKSCIKKTGSSARDIAKAYIVVREAFQLRPVWDAIEALDNKVPAQVQLKAMVEISALAEHAISWFLIRLGRDMNIGDDIQSYGKGVQELSKNLYTLIPDSMQTAIKRRVDESVSNGLPKDLAMQIALLPVLSSACDIIRISLEEKTDLQDTARTYFKLGKTFHLDWLRQQARFMSSDDHWHAEATSGLVDQLYSSQAGLTVRILKDTNGRKGKYDDVVDRWMNAHEHHVEQLNPLFAQLRSAGTIDLSMLIIAEQRLKNLYGG